MPISVTFRGSGHPNITCKHETTVMITKDDHLTLRGDCIAAIQSEIGLKDLSKDIKKLARDEKTKITLILEVENQRFKVTGRGHPNLTYKHPRDMVARKSSYACDRTLMILADKAAIDVDRELVDLLRIDGKMIEIEIIFEDFQ
ncbi:DUF371 domain-containing protein [Candidatus Bathyarchaeota archaeon]|nr:DUF371 domain-containing protein [Candidatus Bathyarchaeota archaeon]